MHVNVGHKRGEVHKNSVQEHTTIIVFKYEIDRLETAIVNI